MKHLYIASLLMLTPIACLGASPTTSAVEGKVVDSFGNAVANASVTLVNTDTNRTSVNHTNSKGRYHFVGLRPASDYVLSVKADGSGHVSPYFSLQLNQTAIYNVALDTK